MNLSYAGVYLKAITDEVATAISERFDPREVLNFEGSAPSHDLWHLPIPFLPPLPEVYPNRLHWPADASRFATFFALVDDNDLATLNPLCWDDNGPIASTLYFEPDSATETESLSVTLWPLPPRPLTQIAGAVGLWLLPLVDIRYFFWMVSADFPLASNYEAFIYGASDASPIVISSRNHGLTTGQIISITGVGGNTSANGVWSITVVDANNYSLNLSTGNGAYTSGGTVTLADGTTWAALIGQIAAALGTPITIQGSIPSAYGVPLGRMVTYRQPPPLYFDAVARTIGFRVVASYDGSIYLQNWGAANDSQEADIGLITSTKTRPPLSGGFFDDTTITQNVPANVAVAFLRSEESGQFNEVPYVINEPLASLGISQYGAIVGYEGAKTLFANLNAIYPGTITLTLGSQSSGTFTLSFTNNAGISESTTALAYDADALTIANALAELSNIGAGNVDVTGTGPFTIVLVDDLPGSSNGITGNFSALTTPSNASITNVPNNITALTNYAVQAATDWYLWQLLDGDLQFNGIVAWTPNGVADLIEIWVLRDRCSTRVSRQAYNELTWGCLQDLGYYQQGGSGGSSLQSDGLIYFKGTLNETTTIGGVDKASIDLLSAGWVIGGDGIPDGATIVTFDAEATTITISAAATLSETVDIFVTVASDESPIFPTTEIGVAAANPDIGRNVAVSIYNPESEQAAFVIDNLGFFGRIDEDYEVMYGPRRALDLIAAQPAIGANLELAIADGGGGSLDDDEIRITIDNLGVFGRIVGGTAYGPRRRVAMEIATPMVGPNLDIYINDNPASDEFFFTIDNLGVFGRAAYGATSGPRRRLNFLNVTSSSSQIAVTPTVVDGGPLADELQISINISFPNLLDQINNYYLTYPSYIYPWLNNYFTVYPITPGSLYPGSQCQILTTQSGVVGWDGLYVDVTPVIGLGAASPPVGPTLDIVFADDLFKLWAAPDYGPCNASVVDIKGGATGTLLYTPTGASRPLWGSLTSVGATILITKAATGINIDLNVPIGVGSGGTGVTSLPNHSVLLGRGAGPISYTGPGGSGDVLIGQGVGSDPAFEEISQDGLLEFNGNFTVTGWQTVPVSAEEPGDLDLMVYNANSDSTWYPATVCYLLQNAISGYNASTVQIIGQSGSSGSGCQMQWMSVATCMGSTLPIVINTTPVSGGTSGNFMYDNSATVGEYTPSAADAALGTSVSALSGTF